MAAHTMCYPPPSTWLRLQARSFTRRVRVAFRGTPASFAVKSVRHISAVVPAGATTGLVTVTTPNGTGTSKQSFTGVSELMV